MIGSILDSTKKVLGLAADYTAFDEDIIMHINSAFSNLHQLGVGPVEGFMIDDNLTSWDDFLMGDHRLSSIKTYVYLKVRIVFDPPSTSYHTTAMQEQIKELEWRINVAVDPLVTTVIIYDGGTP